MLNNPPPDVNPPEVNPPNTGVLFYVAAVPLPNKPSLIGLVLVSSPYVGFVVGYFGYGCFFGYYFDCFYFGYYLGCSGFLPFPRMLPEKLALYAPPNIVVPDCLLKRPKVYFGFYYFLAVGYTFAEGVPDRPKLGV